MSKITNLKHIDHGNYVIDKIRYLNYNCVNPNIKKKKYEKTDDDILENEKFAYSQIIYGKNPIVYITTPKMVCLFGLDKRTNGMCLQFTDYETDKNMASFHEFIKTLEFSQMAYIGLDDESSDLYKSQIRYSDKYDPFLNVKLPFTYNKYDVEIYHDEFPISIMNIGNFNKMMCDIYIDKIWKFNGTYICKWKVKKIYVYK